MKTTLATNSDHTKTWYVVDAANETLGRISVKIANVLRGRHKPTYTPHADTGDFVVVINAEKIKVSGKKNEDKRYMFYSGWMGGAKHITMSDMRAPQQAWPPNAQEAQDPRWLRAPVSGTATQAARLNTGSNLNL